MVRNSPEIAAPEAGFILMATIWLLLLAGAVVSLLMLNTLALSRSVATAQQLLDADFGAESAIDTVLAERMFGDTSGRWRTFPVEEVLEIDGRRMRLRLTSEGGRLDLNEADPQRIDRALQGLGVGAGARGRLLAVLAGHRKSGARLRSLGEIRAIAAEAGITLASGRCLDDLLTFASGRAEPAPDAMPAPLASALAVAASGNGGVSGIDALRIEVVRVDGAVHRVTRSIVRPTATGILVHGFERAAPCSPIGTGG